MRIDAKMAKSQTSDGVGNLISTQSLTLNSMSTYLRILAILYVWTTFLLNVAQMFKFLMKMVLQKKNTRVKT